MADLALIIAVAAIGIAVICISAYLLGTRQRPPRVVLSEPTPPESVQAQIEESPVLDEHEELLADLHREQTLKVRYRAEARRPRRRSQPE